MKARRKGTDEVFKEIKNVMYENGFIVDAKDLEFEQEHNTSDHWQDVRERVAITVAPQCLKMEQDDLFRGGAINEETVAKQVAVDAIEIADALVKILKGE